MKVFDNRKLKKTFGFNRVEVNICGWCVTMDGKTLRTGSHFEGCRGWEAILNKDGMILSVKCGTD
jgi:hypothetical protein